MQTLNQFEQTLKTLTVVKSITGLDYRIRRVTGDNILFSRGTRLEEEKISVIELYNLYLQGTRINTAIAKKYISGRVQSPAVAIINHIRKGKVDSSNKEFSLLAPTEISEHTYVKIPRTEIKLNGLPKDNKDETRFFFAFSMITGDR